MGRFTQSGGGSLAKKKPGVVGGALLLAFLPSHVAGEFTHSVAAAAGATMTTAAAFSCCY